MLTGTGEPEADEAYAEYMAPLCEPGWAAACTQAIARVIAAQPDVAGVELLRVRREAVADLVAALSRSLGSGRASEAVAGTCYDLPAKPRAGTGADVRPAADGHAPQAAQAGCHRGCHAGVCRR
jgi:hypothetical protein